MITWCATRSGHDSGILHFGKAEVADHDLAVFIRAVVEQILRFQISMDHAFAVHVGDRRQNLFDQIGSIFLRVRTFLNDAIKEFSAGDPEKDLIKKKEAMVSSIIDLLTYMALSYEV